MEEFPREAQNEQHRKRGGEKELGKNSPIHSEKRELVLVRTLLGIYLLLLLAGYSRLAKYKRRKTSRLLLGFLTRETTQMSFQSGLPTPASYQNHI